MEEEHSQGFDEEFDDELDIDDDTGDFSQPDYQIVANTSKESKWNQKEIDQKLLHVLELLKKNERRWSDLSGDPSVPFLEDYMKKGLLGRNSKDKAYPTLLHILAKDYSTVYKTVPRDHLENIITYLLENSTSDRPHDNKTQANTYELPVLHVAMNFGNDEFVECVAKCWPRGFPDLLHARDSKDCKTCLHHIFSLPPTCKKDELSALKRIALKRAERLVRCARPETLAAKDSDGNTPVHYALEYRQCYGRPNEYVDIVKEMVLKSDDEMKRCGAINNLGESPIHYCWRTKTNYDNRKKVQTKRILETATERKSAQGVRSQYSTLAGNAKVIRNGTAGHPLRSGNGKSLSSNEAIEESLKERNGKGNKSHVTFNVPDNDENGNDAPVPTPLARRPSFARHLAIGDQADVIHNSSPETASVGEAVPMDIELSSNKGPPQHRPTERQTTSKRDGNAPVRDLLEFLKLHYIRTRSDLKARELIDGKDDSDRNLYFDASGHSQTTSIIELINRMAVGGFHDVLSYVFLPSVKYSSSTMVDERSAKTWPTLGNHSVLRQTSLTQNPDTGSTSLVEVFDALHSVGVRKILRLQVDDLTVLPHSDAAIEKALQGSDSLSKNPIPRPIEVENWDWRKPDLSTDVIKYAAPNAEEISLYWTGNAVVLRAWGSPEGIPRLYLNTKKLLKKVIIYAAPGLETRDRMDEMLRRFKRDVKGHITKDENDEFKIDVIYRMNGLMTKVDSEEQGSEALESKVESEKQHRWVKTMEQFRSALHRIHTALKNINVGPVEKVKVCLIDDGVDLDMLDVYHNVKPQVIGRSFFPGDGRYERPYHRSSGGHGTIMANMILRVNPWVSLIVMRLQDESRGDGSRTIFAETAAQAIYEAARREVDIISMSWTVKRNITAQGNGTKDRLESPIVLGDSKRKESTAILAKAVEEAVKKRQALMFCSASDDFSSAGKDALPYCKGPGYIFRIGAAMWDGQPDSQIEDRPHIDYFFPGNQVAEARNPRDSKPVKFHDGSSVSTALAAGLASLILYCAMIMRTYWKANNNEAKSIEFENYVASLKQRDKMKKAFDNIQKDCVTWKTNNFLPVWEMFDKATQNIVQSETDTGRLQSLGQLVTDICSRISS